MKMPSTYISLLLFGGLMLFFIHNHYSAKKPARPRRDTVMLKMADRGRTHKLSENDFLVFRDVISNVLPALKISR
jgi:hypothetical protein